MITEWLLREFVAESNRIEGINHETLRTAEDAKWMKEWLREEKPSIAWLCEFVSHFQPGAILRNREGLDVFVGNHNPPEGSPKIEYRLDTLLSWVEYGVNPYSLHQEYETLHPFTDCNGRSGRALWLWQMVNQRKYDGSLGFLHLYYYQSLENIQGMA